MRQIWSDQSQFEQWLEVELAAPEVALTDAVRLLRRHASLDTTHVRNLDLTRGLVFSGQLLLDLTAAGMPHEQAYRLVRTHAMKAWEEEGDFCAIINNDREIAMVLTPPQIAEVFSMKRQLHSTNEIFKRAFDV